MVAKLLLLAAGLALAQEPAPPAFHAQTNLLILPFQVSRGSHFVSDLKLADMELLEDGVPRAITSFEAPHDHSPVELVLLFDTPTRPVVSDLVEANPVSIVVEARADARDDFIRHWDETLSRAVLEKSGTDVRVTVYRLDVAHLQRLCRSTADPKELLGAFQRLFTSVPDGEIPLPLPSGRAVLAGKPRPWPLAAAIAALQDSAAPAAKATRMMVIFSQGIDGTTAIPEDVAERANALGIPIYPVMSNFRLRGTVRPETAESRRVDIPLAEEAAFGRLGKLTGGRLLETARLIIDAPEARGILEAIRNEGLTRARSQYLVGFVPSSSGAPREHKLEIRLTSKSTGKLTGGKRNATY